MKELSNIRRDYSKKKLTKAQVLDNPLRQFDVWMKEALDSEVLEPTAMTLCTVSPDNRPASRTVLLKGLENDQFIFYTNYESRKGQHIAQNPNVSLLFFWQELERQVIVEGVAEKVPTEVSDKYFESRPWKSRIGARISPQSHEIENRDVIKLNFLKESTKLIGQKVPRPDNWGGYAVTPTRIEFWQGRPSRLHDRILYTLEDGRNWKIVRLAP